VTEQQKLKPLGKAEAAKGRRELDKAIKTEAEKGRVAS
jgi:hypothetical protein